VALKHSLIIKNLEIEDASWYRVSDSQIWLEQAAAAHPCAAPVAANRLSPPNGAPCHNQAGRQHGLHPTHASDSANVTGSQVVDNAVQPEHFQHSRHPQGLRLSTSQTNLYWQQAATPQPRQGSTKQLHLEKYSAHKTTASSMKLEELQQVRITTAAAPLLSLVKEGQTLRNHSPHCLGLVGGKRRQPAYAQHNTVSTWCVADVQHTMVGRHSTGMPPAPACPPCCSQPRSPLPSCLAE
jgi:hypothetical protein